jgi:hypothetical protein
LLLLPRLVPPLQADEGAMSTNRFFYAVLLMAAISAACLALALTPTASKAATAVRADAADPAGAIFTSDRRTVPDHHRITLRRVALPKPDCSQWPNDCADLDIITLLDGFSRQPRITVFLINLGDTRAQQAASPALPTDPPAFLTSANGGLAPLDQAARRPMATSFATRGALTVDPDGVAAIFEVPIARPLPETLNFIP